MVNVKKACAAGTFYPKTKDELSTMFETFEECEANYSSRAVIVPHAGYIYSGELAFKGYKFLDRNTKNIFIFAPAHYERIYGCVTCDFDEFETPFGNIKVNKELSKEITVHCECQINNHAYEREHSIEVQLPIIKYLFPDAQIIPVLYGCENFTNLAETISKFYDNKENAFVISSDLSHFFPQRESSKIDLYTAKMIEELITRDFDMEQACGAVGICALLDFAKSKNYSLIRVGLTDSSKSTGDTSRVVGYGSWFLFEGEKNEYIKQFYTDLVINICKESINAGLENKKYSPENYPCVLEEYGASFITIELNGDLRGCIGSIIAHRPLIQDLIKNAHSAAFADPRFFPLTQDEFQNIKISVSLLTKPQKMSFENEADLLEQIKPYEDGLIIREGAKQGVFLPVVWEELPDKQEFLNHLKLKAGLDRNYFSDTIEVFKFKAVKITQ